MVIHPEDRMSRSVHLAEDGRSVVILDQRKLPNRQEYLELRTAEEMYDAIKTLAVRGAPAIGICAAYSVYILSLQEKAGEVPGHVAGCIDLPPEKARALYALLYELLDNQKNHDNNRKEHSNENGL